MVETQPVSAIERDPEAPPTTGPSTLRHRRASGPSLNRGILLVIAAAAMVVYAWDIDRMQLHLYYGPGVKTMSESWTAWLSGAYDPGLATTFDKVPGTFWLQALSARVFGFTPWAVLLPSLLATVAAVLLLHRVVTRWTGELAGLAAAACYAVTPMVAALARTQIPDPVLVVLLLAAVAAWQRALATARLAPLMWAGMWVGLAFQAKMAQAWLVWLPLAVGYLVSGVPAGWVRRLWTLGAAGATTIAVSLAWVIPMALVPASARPYIDGSLDNSVWSMVFGYNGFNRYGVSNVGAEVLGVGGPVGAGEGSPWLYLVRDGVAPQIGWLYPLAVLGLVAGLGGLGRAVAAPSRADRATCLMWLLWAAVHTIAFAVSLKPHTFYNLLLVPPLAAFAGAGVSAAWTTYRSGGWSRWLLPGTLAVSTLWAWDLAGRFPTFAPWLPGAIAVTGAVVTLAAVGGAVGGAVVRANGVAVTAAVLALATVLLGPVTWMVSVTGKRSVSDAHRPAAGPASREIASVLSGRLLRLLPADDVDRIGAYVTANTTTERYRIAVQWAPQAGQFLLRDVAALPVGGFTAQVPTITPQQLAEAVAARELRFALVDGPATKGKPTPDYPDYAVWVRQSCRPVADFDQPLYTLYDCR